MLCAFWQKWQKKYESWDLRKSMNIMGFAHKYVYHGILPSGKSAKICIMGFALFAPSGKSGKKYDLRFLRQAAKVAKV